MNQNHLISLRCCEAICMRLPGVRSLSLIVSEVRLVRLLHRSENKRQRDKRVSRLQYWILQTMPQESLMNFIQFHSNGYQGGFIHLAFVSNYWLSQERWGAQSPGKQQVISISGPFGRIILSSPFICLHERRGCGRSFHMLEITVGQAAHAFTIRFLFLISNIACQWKLIMFSIKSY